MIAEYSYLVIHLPMGSFTREMTKICGKELYPLTKDTEVSKAIDDPNSTEDIIAQNIAQKVKAIMAGQVAPIILDFGAKKIISKNDVLKYRAMLYLGWKHIPTIIRNCEMKELGYVVMRQEKDKVAGFEIKKVGDEYQMTFGF